MIELQELKSYDDLPSISLDDVQGNPFTEYLNLCFGLILDDIAKRTGKETELFNNMSTNEEYVIKEHEIQESLFSSLESIDYAIHFIESYGEKDYLKSDFIPFEKFAAYHYDVVCHKVSTVKDLFFKLTNHTYNLELGNEECKWKNIKKNENTINNPVLFDLFNANEKLNSKIKDKRNDSSHEGKQAIPFSHDIRLYFWAVEANEVLSHSLQSNPIYERNSFEYSNQINLAKEDTSKEIGVIRYNTFAITKCILCSLSERLIENVKQLLPDLDKRVMDSLTKAE